MTRLMPFGFEKTSSLMIPALALGAVAGIALPSQAASYGFVTLESSYEVRFDETLMVDLYLQETLDPNETSPLITATGLLSFELEVVTIASQTQPATVIGNTPNPVFNDADDILDEPQGLPANQVSKTLDFFALEGVGFAPNTNLVFLTSIEIQPGTIINEKTTFRIQDIAATAGTVDNNLLYDLTVLDDVIAPGEFIVKVVPSPATLTGASLLFAGLLIRRR